VKFVPAHGFFQGLSHLAFHPKESVCRHHSVNALVWPKVVVVGHEMPEPFLGFREILRLNPLPKFFPHRGPKPFRFAYGLGMVSARHHVLDAFPYQQFLEVP
jgi:hypothetical protein